MVRIVGIGGGTGLSVLLRGLTEAAPSYDLNDSPSPLTISAIVCVSDNGGSSGRLRESLVIRLPDKDEKIRSSNEDRGCQGKGAATLRRARTSAG